MPQILSTSADIQCLKGVLLVNLSGVVTKDSMMRVKQQIAASRHGPFAVYLVDFSRALYAGSGADLDAVLAGEETDPTSMRPAALLVSPANTNTFVRHGQRMAARGITRRVFTDRASAFWWSERQAALAASD